MWEQQRVKRRAQKRYIYIYIHIYIYITVLHHKSQVGLLHGARRLFGGAVTFSPVAIDPRRRWGSGKGNKQFDSCLEHLPNEQIQLLGRWGPFN